MPYRWWGFDFDPDFIAGTSGNPDLRIKNSKTKTRRENTFYIWCFLYLFLRPIFKLFTHIRIKGHKNVAWLPKEYSYIVIANHTSYLDPFVLGYALFEINRKLCPIRFMTKKEFSFFPLGEILTFFGAFFIDTKDKKSSISGMRKALEILSKKGNVGIFPEGTRSKKGTLLPFQEGTESLAKKTKAYVIPVLILGTFKPGRGFISGIKKTLKFFSGKYRIKVVFGPLFIPSFTGIDLEQQYRNFCKQIK